MPNRIIKESICTSENLNNLTAEEEAFFYRLIVNSDDYGRLDGRAAIVRARCYPLRLDTVTDTNIEKWLKALVAAGLVHTYKVNNKTYLQVDTWERHQQKRAKHSKFPGPDGNVIADDINCKHMITYVPEKRETRNEKRETRNDIDVIKTSPKYKFGEFENVLLTLPEEKKLDDAFGHGAEELIQRLSAYKSSKGKKYKSDYATILNWARRDGKTPTASDGQPEIEVEE